MSVNAPERSDDLIEVLAAGSGVVCLVGAGGKKSTIYRIASRSSGRIAVTATVYTPRFRKRLAAETLIAAPDELAARVAGASASRVVAYACPSDKKARLAGVDPGRVVEIHESCGFDVTLVKADGARLRRLKAPGAHEPAVPRRFATLIPLVSVRAVGEPLDRIVAHRPELIAELTGAGPGQRLTAEHVARLLAHSRGGLKHAERAEHVVPVINMVDSDEQRHTARLIAGQVLEQAARVDRVVLTRMISDEPVIEVIRR